ncbi:MAG: hypothetical protein AAGH88_00075 [Planctomycetota bacterium]
MSSNNPLSNIPPLGPPSGMAPTASAGKFKTIDPMKVIRQYWLLFSITAVVAVVIGVGTWFVLDTYMPKYTSIAQISVNKGLESGSDAVTNDVNIRDLEPEIQNNLQRLRSEEFLRDVIRQDSIGTDSIRNSTVWYTNFQSNDLEAARDLKDNRLRAVHQPDSTLIRLQVTTGRYFDPKFKPYFGVPLPISLLSNGSKDDSQIILQSLYDHFVLSTNDTDLNPVRQERSLYQRNISSLEGQISTLEDDILNFMRENEVGLDDLRFETLVLDLSRKAQQRAETEVAFTSAKGIYDALLTRQQQDDFEPSAGDIFLIEGSQEIIGLDAQIRRLEAERGSLLARDIAENNLVIRRLDTEILTVRQQRSEEFDNKARELFNKNLEEARQAMELYQAQLTQYESDVLQLENRRRDLQRLQTQLKNKQKDLEKLEGTLESEQTQLGDAENRLERMENQQYDRTVSVSKYTPPTEAEKTFPKPGIVIPGITMLLLGSVVGLVFLKELLDHRLKGPGDVKALPDTTMLGIIPHSNEDASSRSDVERVVEREPGGLLAESFRQVRTAILSKMDRRGYKTLVLVGAKPEGGVSGVAQNLGASMALSGRRVLILDANFRRPSQAKLAGVGAEPGLAELLSGGLSPEQAEQAIRQNEHISLDVLTAGSSSAQSPELLETAMFRDLLSRLESVYDVILIDVAPALLASEAKLLAKHVDALVIVCRAMSDTRGMLQKVIGELDGQRADILGVILNGVRSAAGGYMRKNFREFYTYRAAERGSSDRASSRTTRRAPNAAAAVASPPGNGTASNGHYEDGPDLEDTPADVLDFDFEADDREDS